MNVLFRKTGAIAAICLLHCGSADARLHDRYRSHDFYPHCCRPYPHRILVAPVRPAIALRISNRFDRKGRLIAVHADAQDAAQETFVRIFRAFGRFDARGSLTAWIYRIATLEALRILSRHREERLSLTADSAAAGARADTYVDYGDLEAVRLQNVLLSLPTKQRIVFSLRYYDELTYEEIAEATNSTVCAAKANYHLAKEKIIRYMNSHD